MQSARHATGPIAPHIANAIACRTPHAESVGAGARAGIWKQSHAVPDRLRLAQTTD